MWIGISAALEAFFEAIKSGCNFAQTSKEHQAETEVIKDRKDLQKAVDISEQAFKLMFSYADLMKKRDRKKLQRLYDDFIEHN